MTATIRSVTTLNCPNCGASITPRPDTEGYQCGFCHTVFYPGEEDDGVAIAANPDQQLDGSGQSCPLCSQPLVQAAVGRIPVQYCTQCHGLLIPMGALPPLIDQAKAAHKAAAAVQAPPDQGDLKRAIQCPQCHHRMDTHFYAGPGNVIIDSCSNCLLIWLDRGELTRIAHAPDEPDPSDSDW